MKEKVIKAIISDINKSMPAIVNEEQQEEINKSYYNAIKSNLDAFDINDKIPAEIQTYKKENGLNNVLGALYTPKIYYIKATNKWRCNYSSDINLLFFVEGESIEELIGKVWEHIESKEYGEIYDLTYNFKEWEM